MKTSDWTDADIFVFCKSLLILADFRLKSGDKTVFDDISMAVELIGKLKRERDKLRAEKNETRILIPESELKDWLEHVSAGLEPVVAYSNTPGVMAERAYEFRGKMLNSLKEKIEAKILPKID